MTTFSIRSLILHLTCASALVACTQDDALAPRTETEDGATATVRYTIDIPATAWQVGDDDDTRAKPPGVGGGSSTTGPTADLDDGWAETQGVDRIRVMVFRRKASKTYYDDEDGFEYDPDNSQTLTVLTDESGHTDDLYPESHYHKTATGTLTKSAKYDYHIVCVAYTNDWNATSPYTHISGYNDASIPWASQSTTSDIHKAHLTLAAALGTPLSDAKGIMERGKIDTDVRNLTLPWQHYLDDGYYLIDEDKNSYIAYPPPLFYGKLHLAAGATPTTAEYPDPDTCPGSESPVIHFSDSTASGDVRSDLPLTGTLLRGMAKVEVVIDDIQQTKHGSYGLHGAHDAPTWITLLADNVKDQVRLNSYDAFDFNQGNEIKDKSSARFYTLDAVQPAAGTTSVRLAAYLLPCKTRLALRMHINHYGISGNTNVQLLTGNHAAADTPTGVINPETRNGIFYLKRNHKYVIHISHINDVLDDGDNTPNPRNHEFWDSNHKLIL